MADIQMIPPNTEGLMSLDDHFGQIRKGENILVNVGGAYSLMKYDGHKTEAEDFHSHRIGRNGGISTVLSELLPHKPAERNALEERKRREHKRHKGNIHATHRLDFVQDPEFGIFLPSSHYSSDLYLTLAVEDIDGNVTPREKDVDIMVGDEIITTELRKILRPGYFENVALPFLEGTSTGLRMPGYRRKWLFGKRSDEWIEKARFARETKDMKHGSFVYVGCKEEVYLLGLAKDGDGNPYRQGTYFTSTKPLMYFSNNYLRFISRYDGEKPKAPEGMKTVNVAEYRTYDLPGFGGKPFIFPQIGRSQDCKNTIFTGRPDIITDKVHEALAHFKTTDFAEFGDVVASYAHKIFHLHSSAGKPNGKYYY